MSVGKPYNMPIHKLPGFQILETNKKSQQIEVCLNIEPIYKQAKIKAKLLISRGILLTILLYSS